MSIATVGIEITTPTYPSMAASRWTAMAAGKICEKVGKWWKMVETIGNYVWKELESIRYGKKTDHGHGVVKF